MAVTDEWDAVSQALDRLEPYSRLRPTLVAMRKLVDMVKHDAAFVDVHPRVSMASILFARTEAKRRVIVACDEDGSYEVSFVDPPLEFSESTTVGEDAVVRVVRDYVDRLGDT